MSKTDSEKLRGLADDLYEVWHDEVSASVLIRIADEHEILQEEVSRLRDAYNGLLNATGGQHINRKAPSDEEIEKALISELQNIPQRFKIEKEYYRLGFLNCAEWMRKLRTRN